MNWKPLKGISLALITLSLGLGTFMQVLDITVANVSIPAIAGDLGKTPMEGTWVITSFAVCNAIVLPLTGWFSLRFGQVRLFVAATALFSLFSWLCGMAGNLTLLVIFRALQGAVAGLLLPLSQSLLMLNYAEEKKGVALGFWTTIIIVAPIAGPVLGGWITDNWGWRWIFYINIPLGIFSSFCTWKLLAKRETPKMKKPIDLIGFLLLIVTIGSVQLFLDLGRNLDVFTSPLLFSLICLGVIGLVFFVIWTIYSPYPVIDFSFFKHSSYTVALIVITLGFFIYFGSVVLFPLWLQTDMGYTAEWAGLSLAPGGIFALLFSPIIGNYLHKFDLRLLISASCCIFALSFFMFSAFTTQVSFYQLIIPRFLVGVAMAIFAVPLTALSLSEIPRELYASAAGVTTFVRMFFSIGFGTVLSMTLWQQRGEFHYNHLADSINPQNNVLANLELLQIGGAAESSQIQLSQLVNQQAVMLSLNDYFWLGGWIFLMLIPLLWLCKVPNKDVVKRIDVPVE